MAILKTKDSGKEVYSIFLTTCNAFNLYALRNSDGVRGNNCGFKAYCSASLIPHKQEQMTNGEESCSATTMATAVDQAAAETN